MLEPSLLSAAQGYLGLNPFYLEGHTLIWESILRLRAKALPCDTTSILADLRTRGELDAVGGAGYVTALANTVPTAGYLEHHCRQVKEKADLRRILDATRQIGDSVYNDPDADPLELAALARRKLDEITAGGKNEAVLLGDAGKEAAKDAEFLRAQFRDAKEWQPSPSTVLFGLPKLDHLTGGIEADMFAIVGSYASQGKTTFCLQVARAAARAHKVVLVCSLEESPARIWRRVVCAEAGVSVGQLVGREELPERQGWEKKIHDAKERIAGWQFYVRYNPQFKVRDISALARRVEGVALLIVDYCQLIHPEKAYRDNKVAELESIVQDLHALPADLGIPVLAASQMRRQGDGKYRVANNLERMLGTGAYEREGDIVLGLIPETPKGTDTGMPTAPTSVVDCAISVLKQRTGAIANIPCSWNKACYNFKEKE